MVETRKRLTGVHRNEKRIEVLGTVLRIADSRDCAVCGRDPRFEIEVNLVCARAEVGPGNRQVAVLLAKRLGRAVDFHVAGGAVTVIEYQRAGRFQIEPDRDMPGHGRGLLLQLHLQPIPDIGDEKSPVAGQIP